LNCSECGGLTISPDGLLGERVCTKCGLVVGETLVSRHFAQWSPNWPSNWGEHDSETLKEWLTVLRTISCQLNIPNFPYREEVARLIRKESGEFFQVQKFAKDKRSTVAALLQLILKEYGTDRSIRRMCQQLSLDSKLVLKQTWSLKKSLRGGKRLKNSRKTSKEYLYKYGGKLTCDSQLLLAAEKTLIKFRRKGGNPLSLAAGAFYHACKMKRIRINKKLIGKTLSVSDRTVDTNERRIRRLLTSVPPK
jgi:transcription initiation factor TFIIIB Brf1 subunit/transcription initiation factor TFIIB